ncbi:hypothetical protein COCHEDRAFT_1217333 [Bipolaris maydis C5]|uniref:Uncharacterized protein n=2 Tax=Cochliobolus heterostrophus TaxID=5016 RepID=M2UK09_COCH5|nr:hypothetical protein COCHEDRAFT_1217333 [Bipolaris maydis C5]KAJ5024511.1 hypothetical protein J3E73DRAFT_398982 [Bipolaris maydis]KAJ6207238.1 hypothetical protein PSV09DRAFT_1217333 [Bipolaris maydis]KAJ6268261.1 hypothetical protein PSV08DRAFT_378344 [Bipolaris maydis]
MEPNQKNSFLSEQAKIAYNKLRLAPTYPGMKELRDDVKSQLTELNFYWGKVKGTKPSRLQKEGIEEILRQVLWPKDEDGMPIQPTTRLSSVIQRQGLVNGDASLNNNPEALPSPTSATPLHTNLSASLTSSSEPQRTAPATTASALPEATTSLTHIRPNERDENQADTPSRRRVFPLSIPSLPSYKRPTPPPLLQEPTNSTPTREDTTKPRATLEAQKHQTANSQQYSVYNNARRLPLSILLDSTVDGSSNTTDSNTTTVVQQADIPVRIQQQRTRSTAFSLQSRQALPSQSRKPSMSRSRLPSYIEISDSDSDYENESDDENESDVRTTSHSNILANTRTHNTVDRTRNISFTRLSTIAKEKSMSSQQQCDGGEKENQDPTTVASSNSCGTKRNFSVMPNNDDLEVQPNKKQKSSECQASYIAKEVNRLEHTPSGPEPRPQVPDISIPVIQQPHAVGKYSALDFLGLFAKQTTGKFKMFILGGFLQCRPEKDEVDVEFLVTHPAHKDPSEEALIDRKQEAYKIATFSKTHPKNPPQ